jgi:DNA-binding transcriptional LysR family regulator
VSLTQKQTSPLISAGLGIGLLPKSSLQTTHPPVAWLRLNTPNACRTLTLAWRTDTYLSTAAKRFRDLATQQLRKSGPSEKVAARPLAG